MRTGFSLIFEFSSGKTHISSYMLIRLLQKTLLVFLFCFSLKMDTLQPSLAANASEFQFSRVNTFLNLTYQADEQFEHLRAVQQLGDTPVGMWSKPTVRRKTKIVCTIGPSTDTKEMIWKLAEAGMNVARLNMSHGDHASHQKVIDLVREYNAQSQDNCIAIMLDTKASYLYPHIQYIHFINPAINVGRRLYFHLYLPVINN